MKEIGVRRGAKVRVYKYPLTFDERGVAETSIPGTITHVGFDPQQVLCVWAVVWPEEFEPAQRQVLMVGTGHDLPPGTWGYLQTIHDPWGMVWHFFAGWAQ